MKKEKKDLPIGYPPLPLDLRKTGKIDTDPMGTYTGRPLDGMELPVQDADDL